MFIPNHIIIGLHYLPFFLFCVFSFFVFYICVPNCWLTNLSAIKHNCSTMSWLVANNNKTAKTNNLILTAARLCCPNVSDLVRQVCVSCYLNLCLTRHPITIHPPFCRNGSRVLQNGVSFLASVRKYQNNRPYARSFYFLFVHPLTLPTCFPSNAATSTHNSSLVLKVISNAELCCNAPH